MKKVLASVLCGMTITTIGTTLAAGAQDNRQDGTTQLPVPIAISTPIVNTLPVVIDNDVTSKSTASSDQSKAIDQDSEAPKQIADSTAPAQATQSGTPTAFPKTGIGGQFEKLGKFAKTLPKRLPPTIVGTLGGTPFAFVQQTTTATKDGVKDIVGDSKFPLFVAPAFCLSVPYALVSGVIGGPVEAFVNGWSNSKDKPYSRASFSLPSK